MEKYRRLMDGINNLTSTNRGFRTIKHRVTRYEQAKKELSFLYPKSIVQSDGIHTAPLNI